METRNKRIFAAMFIITMLSVFAIADTQTASVQFVIPSSVVHALSYGTVDAGTCGTGASDMYFVEKDGTKDGTDTKIYPSDDTAGTVCQNTTVAGMTISNSGTIAINVSAKIDTLDTGVELKTTLADAGYEDTCSNTVSTSTCVDISTSFQNIVEDIAVSGSDDIWWFADFTAYNSGSATDGTQRTVTTNATQA